MSETSHYLSTGHSFIYVLSVREVTLSTHRSLIYIRPQRRALSKHSHSFIYVLSVRDIALSKHRSLIYIRPKGHRCRII